MGGLEAYPTASACYAACADAGPFAFAELWSSVEYEGCWCTWSCNLAEERGVGGGVVMGRISDACEDLKFSCCLGAPPTLDFDGILMRYNEAVMQGRFLTLKPREWEGEGFNYQGLNRGGVGWDENILWLNRELYRGDDSAVMAIEGDPMESCMLYVVDGEAVLYLTVLQHDQVSVSLHNQINRHTLAGWEQAETRWKLRADGKLEPLNNHPPGEIYVLGCSGEGTCHKPMLVPDGSEFAVLTFMLSSDGCDKTKCRTTDGSGGFDCLADGEYEKFECADGYDIVVTGAGGPGPTWFHFPNPQPAYEAGAYTWDSARLFCEGKGATLCSYDDLCTPAGEFQAISGEGPGDADNWTPYLGEGDFQWTNTGSDRRCMKEGGSQDSWHGMSHCCNDDADMVCCNMGGGGHSSGLKAFTCCPAAGGLEMLPAIDWNMQHCDLSIDWHSLARIASTDPHAIATGGLGKLMQVGEMEVWLCYRDHWCSTPSNHMCWVYLEQKGLFTPWAQNQSLGLLRGDGGHRGNHDGSKCSDIGDDCCASAGWDEPQTCRDGYEPIASSPEECPSSWDDCKHHEGGIGCYGCYPPAGVCERAQATHFTLFMESTACSRLLEVQPDDASGSGSDASGSGSGFGSHSDDRVTECVAFLQSFTHDLVGQLKRDLQDCRAIYESTEEWGPDWEGFVDIDGILFVLAWTPAQQLGLQSSIPIGPPRLDWCPGALMAFEFAKSCTATCSDDCRQFVRSMTPEKIDAAARGLQQCALKPPGNPFNLVPTLEADEVAMALLFGPYWHCGFDDSVLNIELRKSLCQNSDIIQTACAAETEFFWGEPAFYERIGVSSDCFDAVNDYYTERPRPPPGRACEELDLEEAAAKDMVSPACKVALGIPCPTCEESWEMLGRLEMECPRACKESQEEDSSLPVCNEGVSERSIASCGISSCHSFLQELKDKYLRVSQGFDDCPLSDNPGDLGMVRSLGFIVQLTAGSCGMIEVVREVAPPLTTCPGLQLAMFERGRILSSYHSAAWQSQAQCEIFVSSMSDESIREMTIGADDCSYSHDQGTREMMPFTAAAYVSEVV